METATPSQGADRSRTTAGLRTGLGTISAGLPSVASASGSQASTTLSAIAAGGITLTSGNAASASVAQTISRDTSEANQALTKQFTDAKRADIAEGFAAVQGLTQQIGIFFNNRATDQKKAEDAAIAAGVARNPDGSPRRDAQGNLIALNPEAQTQIDKAGKLRDNFGAGSAARIAATALSGAAGSNVAGGLGSLAQGAAVNVLQSLAVTEVKKLADSFGQRDDKGNFVPTRESEAVRTALQAITGCAGSAAGGSGDCGSAAAGAAASVVLNNLLSTGVNAATDKDGNPLNLEEQQARTNLIATIIGGIVAAAGGDAAAATTAAQIETENNGERLADGSLVEHSLTPGAFPIRELLINDIALKAAVDAARNPGESDEQVIERYREYTACLEGPINGQNCSRTDPRYVALDALGSVYTSAIGTRQRIDEELANGTYTAFLDPNSPLHLRGGLTKLAGFDNQYVGGLYSDISGRVFSASGEQVGVLRQQADPNQLSGLQRFGYGALGVVQVVLGTVSGAGAVVTSELCATVVGCVVPGAFAYGAATGYDNGFTNFRRAYEGNSNYATLGATTIRLVNNGLGGTASTADAERYYGYSQIAAAGVNIGYAGYQVGSRIIANRAAATAEAATVNRLALEAFNIGGPRVVINGSQTVASDISITYRGVLGPNAGAGQARAILEGGTGQAIAGHGNYLFGSGNTLVPAGTSVLRAPDGVRLLDTTGRFMESVDTAAFAAASQAERTAMARSFLVARGVSGDLFTDVLRQVRQLEVVPSGGIIPNYTITAPSSLQIYRNSTTVTRPTLLQDLLRPNAGCVALATCTTTTPPGR